MTTQLKYKLAENTIPQEDLNALADWLKGGPWLTQGELVRRFEEAFARWLGVKHAVFVNSGSSANLLAYYALTLSGNYRYNTLVVPAVAWSTSVAPAIQLGLSPVLCDADGDTWGLDPLHLSKLCHALAPFTVVLVHVLGYPARMDAIMELRNKYGFHLIEDACGALGSTYNGRLLGTFGDLSTFSFFYGHQIATIEGGMVCTNDENLYLTLLALREHGWGRRWSRSRQLTSADALQVPEFNRQFTFYEPGFNVRNTELGAFLGLRQMERLVERTARRKQNHIVYRDELRDFYIQSCPSAEPASIAFGVLASSGEHRTRIVRALQTSGVETRPIGTGNTGRQPFWVKSYGVAPMPVPDLIYYCGFQLPNHPGLTEEDIKHICSVVRQGA